VKGMKDETRRTKWENFVDKYQDYLMSDEDLYFFLKWKEKNKKKKTKVKKRKKKRKN